MVVVEQHLSTIFSWLLLALQVKVGKVASFAGKIFVVRAYILADIIISNDASRRGITRMEYDNTT